MEETNVTPQVQNDTTVDTATFEEKIKDMSARFMSLAPLLCSIGIGIWWCFYGMVKIVPTSLSITQRIGVTICTVFIAITYCNLLAIGGFESAKKTDTYQQLASEWNDAITRGNKHKREIIEYAKDVARNNLKDLRQENLERNGLDYYEIFNDAGELVRFDYKTNKYNKRKNPSGYTKHQIRIINKCLEYRIEIPEMFGNISSRFFGVKKRISQKKYEKQSTIRNLAIRLVVSSVSVGFMFQWIGISAGALIYAMFQIVLWTASGLLQRMKNFNFIVREIQPQILENTMMINGYLELDQDKKDVYTTRVQENDAAKHRLQIEYRGEQK